MSHKLGDAKSLFMFLTSWVAMARGDTKAILTPTFGHAETFPPTNIPKPDFGRVFAKEKFITKKFVFDGSSIEALKAKHNNTRGNKRQLSRVEALTGFILGRYIASTQSPKANKMKCVVKYAIDLRQRMELPMTKQLFGNMVTAATIEAQIDSEDKYCLEVVGRVRDSVITSAQYMNKNRKKPEQLLNLIRMTRETYGQSDVVSFMFTSLNKFPIYESDFRWGKPTWVGISPATGKNIAYLYQTKDGEGMVACISLNEEDMAKFDADEHVLLRTSSS